MTNIKFEQMLAQMSIIGIGIHSAELGVAVICDKLKGMTKQDLERDWDAYPIGVSVPSGSRCASTAPTPYAALFPGHLLLYFLDHILDLEPPREAGEGLVQLIHIRH